LSIAISTKAVARKAISCIQTEEFDMVALIYVSYPRKPGAKFDMDYYINTHMKIVEKHWTPFGMKDWTVVQFKEDDLSGTISLISGSIQYCLHVIRTAN